MTLMRNDVTRLLATARNLLGRPHLDIKSTIALLNEMPEDVDETTQESVTNALRLVWATKRDRSHEGVARFALARVIVMIERERHE